MDEDVIFEVGQPESDVHIDFEGCAEVSLPEPISETIAFVVDDVDAEVPAEEFFVPGAPHVKKPEKKEDKEKADDGEKVVQPKDEWDWKPYAQNNEKLLAWANERFLHVPAHRGDTVTGCQRAKSYCKKLVSELHSAVTSDILGKLDDSAINELIHKIDGGIKSLDTLIEHLEKTPKTASADIPGFTKEASTQKINAGVVAVVPLLLMRLAKVCIEATNSAGHDLKNVFAELSKKWKLDDREQAELEELLLVMGFPLTLIDRGYMVSEDVDLEDGKYDFQSQYPGA
jgi:hypothetical protein